MNNKWNIFSFVSSLCPCLLSLRLSSQRECLRHKCRRGLPLLKAKGKQLEMYYFYSWKTMMIRNTSSVSFIPCLFFSSSCSFSIPLNTIQEVQNSFVMANQLLTEKLFFCLLLTKLAEISFGQTPHFSQWQYKY